MTPLIDVRHLSKTYSLGEVEVHALSDVTITISRGSFVAVMGPSGSGKSTFMNIIGCLDRPTSGSYFLDGVSVESMERDELAEIRNRKIGFVFQNFNLLARVTALENAKLPLLYADNVIRDADARAAKALAAVGLEGQLQNMPSQLSGGQQQRVAIARAIVNEPQIILADEPTGALDTKTSREIMTIFRDLNQTRSITVIVVTHSDEVAAYADRIIYFRDGRLVNGEAAVPMPVVLDQAAKR
ncbi:ABC transporter ATP-binding protein [Acidipila rosea]|uniref:Putative ABC transport system ATP-binding protein n=1 Tax=Acidipila rosea TaxID=768535 RepID=A0A4R1L8T5_9BACT|nr:ABC transporter ATP-binding protein [Acidipila rosea]MBW4026256.1 ABC transporter ATP-binding protein [Acidobacteriota bacterium]MBW4044608.1 ABC transporter ATP-binding protein [Acidobacteriota bacterium]TCK72779.1 putative ABC transport system ATP-binding protein [Acidipila rosea]